MFSAEKVGKLDHFRGGIPKVSEVQREERCDEEEKKNYYRKGFAWKEKEITNLGF